MEFTLHPRQSEAFQSEATEILYGGAAGGGKSYLLRIGALAWALRIEGLQIYLFRRNYPELFSNHMEGSGSFSALLSSWVSQGLCHIRMSTTPSIQFSNGSKIHLRHCQHAKDIYNYQGVEFHVLLIDELTHFTEDMYLFLRSRVRLGGLKIPSVYQGQFPRILASANPGGIGHNWVKETFVDPIVPFEVHKMPAVQGGLKRQYIQARLEDNPTLVENDPGYMDRLEGLGNPLLVKALREGSWELVAGGMIDDLFDRSVHVVPFFRPPSSWKVDRCFDWGSSRPFAVLWVAQSDGSPLIFSDYSQRSTCKGDLFVIAEWYGWNGKANQGVRMIASEIARGILEKEKEMRLSVVPGPADTSIFSMQNGNSIAEDMGRQGVKWLRADKSPGSRVQGWEKLRSFLKAGKVGEGPGLYFCETCFHSLRTLPVLPRDHYKADDVDTQAEDHIADALRYRLMLPQERVARSVKLIGL